jgi:renalase
MVNMVETDVVVVGAGVAGLICAQRLQQLGKRVIVVEKSRGLGGRLATRRLPKGHADHGVRYLEEQGSLTHYLIDRLCKHQVLQPWSNRLHTCDRSGGLHPFNRSQIGYASEAGITSVAKVLGTGLEIWRNRRVTAITITAEQTWALTFDSADSSAAPALTAKALVVAIPAPQALDLLEPLVAQGLAPEVVTNIRSVQFSPCITAIAAYPNDQQPIADSLPWQAVAFSDDPDLDWVAIDSSKQSTPAVPTVIVQSTATFAEAHLDAIDLQPVGQHLLDRAATLASWLAAPEILQVHRWRYAFVSHPLSVDSVVVDVPLPMVCAGDWCGGGLQNSSGFSGYGGIESALRSGLAAAERVEALLVRSSGLVNHLANEDVEAMLAETIEGIWEIMS